MASRGQRKILAEQTMVALKEGCFGGYEFGDELRRAVELSRVHDAKEVVEVGRSGGGGGEVIVMQGTTLEACEKYHGMGKLGVLNFASARNPGGGFLNGSQAQEESLARSSGLYPCLTKFTNEMYIPNRNAPSGAYTHTMIVSPDVPVFRKDDGTAIPPYLATFVSAPAPNNGVLERKHRKTDASSLVSEALEERVKRILYHMSKEKCSTIILGAYGCGVFGNHPEAVADIFKKQLKMFSFPRIVFSITDPKFVAIFDSILRR